MKGRVVLDNKTVLAIINANFLIPKQLIIGKNKPLSLYAVFTYSLLLDRTMNFVNCEIDENGKRFIVFTRKELSSLLKININKVTKIMQELNDAKLISERRTGLGAPNKIYINPIQKSGEENAI